MRLRRVISLLLAIVFITSALPAQAIGDAIEQAMDQHAFDLARSFEIAEEAIDTLPPGVDISDLDLPLPGSFEQLEDSRQRYSAYTLDAYGYPKAEKVQPFTKASQADLMTLSEKLAFENDLRESGAAVAAASATAADDLNQAPYTYQYLDYERINLNKGSLIYEHTNVVLPGRNGFDLEIGIRYDSSNAYTKVSNADLGTSTYRPRTIYAIETVITSYLRQNGSAVSGTSHTSYNVNNEVMWRYATSQSSATATLNGLCGTYVYPNYFGSGIDLVQVVTGEVLTTQIAERYDVEAEYTKVYKYADLGVGWHFNFSYLEFEKTESTRYTGNFTLYRSDGTTEICAWDTRQSVMAYSTWSGQISGVTRNPTSPVSGITPAYLIRYADGIEEYFLASGRLCISRDRFGNTIKFEYNSDESLKKITDSAGRVVNISYVISGNNKTVTVTMPDQSTVVYTLVKVLTSNYQLTSMRDQMGQVTTFTHETDSLVDQFFTVEPWNWGYLLNPAVFLTSVTHPTGARSEYTYSKDNFHTGNQRAFDVKRVTGRKDIVNGTTANAYTYSYLSTYHDSIYKLVHSSNGTPQLTYGTFVTDASGVVQSTFFGYNGQVRQAIHVGNTLKTVAVQENNSRQAPIKVHSKTYGASTSFMERIELFEYDSTGNVTAYWSPLSGGQKTAAHKVAYTYGSYKLPLSKTYRTSSNTTIAETNTLTSNGKSIASTVISENGVSKAKVGYAYDNYGQITSVKDYRDDLANYTETVYAYDTYGNITAQYQTNIKNAAGQAVTSSGLASGRVGTRQVYNIMGRATTVYDDRGYATGYAYNALGQVTQVTHPDNSTVSYARNYAQNILTVTDEVGTQTRYSYNPLGHETQIWDVTGNQQISNKTYDARMRLKTEQGAIGTAITTYGYDALDRVTSKVSRDGSTVVAQETYTYDDGNALGQKITQTLSGSGSAAPNQVNVSYTDALGRVVRAGRVVGGTEQCATFEYDFIGRKISEKSAQAHAENWNVSYTTRWEYTYDSQVARQYNALGQHIRFEYLNTTAGRQVRSYDYAGAAASQPYYSTATYDDLGRLIREETPVVQSGGVIHYGKSEYYYDRNGVNGLLESTRKLVNAPGDADSWQVSVNQYNNRGFLIQSSLLTNGVAHDQYTYTYDLAGRMLSMTDALNHTTGYQYDHRGLLVTLTDALGQEESYSYNAAGLMTSKTDRNGAEHTWGYDALGRETAYEVGDSFRYTQYSLLGQPLRMENETAIVTCQYDALGRRVLESETSPEGTVTQVFAYDAGDQRTSMSLTVDGQSKTTGYVYDYLGRLTEVSQGSDSASYTYDLNGNRTSQTVGDVDTTYTYNLAGWVTTMGNTVNSQTHSGFTYSYLLDGNQSGKVDTVLGESVSYSYDAQGRLSSETYAQGLAITGAAEYTYDRAGNRIAMTDTRDGESETEYTFDANNRLIGTEQTFLSGVVKLEHYTYDANGNQLSRRDELLTPVELVTESPGLSFHGSYQINTWNAAGQLVAMSNEHHSAQYTYTPSGLRHSKSVNDRETVHIWDGSAMAAEVTEDDTVWYIRGLGLLWCQDGSGVSTYAFNAHGDVVGLIGESGQDYTYDAFGNQLSGGVPIGLMTPQQVSADSNPFRYCGEYFDAETGYVYLRARYYDASIGGFVSEDPIRDGMNWYAYCMGNPLIFMDPSGCVIQLSGTDSEQILILSDLNKLTDHLLGVDDNGVVFIAYYNSKKGDLKNGNELIERMIDDQHTATITLGDRNTNDAMLNNNSWSEHGAGSNITYNPEDGTSYLVNPTTGNVEESWSPSYIGLAHELIHADRAMRGVSIPTNNRGVGTIRYQVDLIFTGLRWVVVKATERWFKEEFATVGLGYNKKGDITENDIRSEQNLSLRGSYLGGL